MCLLVGVSMSERAREETVGRGRPPPPLPLPVLGRAGPLGRPPGCRFGLQVMSAARKLCDLVYPRSCAGCGEPMQADVGHLCWECMAALEIVTDPFCSWCGDPVFGKVDHAYTCSLCEEHAPAFDRARSAVRYRGPIQNVIQAFKYGYHSCLSHDMLGLLQGCVAAHYADAQFDGVCWVPLSPARERKRGFNQARILASGLARRLGIRLMPPCLLRTRDTTSQTGLSMSQRRLNVKGVFGAAREEWIDGKFLLLVDDVMTTGATVHECARTLKKAGAAGVHVLTVARG